MNDRGRTRKELVQELEELREQVAELTALKLGRKISAEALRQSEETARSLLNATTDAALLMRLDGTLLALNEVAAQKLGGTAQELVGRNLFELLTYDMAEEFRARATEVTKSGASVRYVYANGGQFIDNSLVPVFRGAGKVDRLAVFSRDITKQALVELELHKARQAAVSADVAKSSFLAQMSHELRTPLNAIIGFSEILEDQTFGPLNERQLRYIGHVNASGRHLLELINQILDLSKVEAGKMELHVSRVNIPQLLESGFIMIMEKARKHRIEIALRIESELSKTQIQADELKLRQIVFNLLSNAAKFTPDGGRIELSAWKEGSELIVSVSDNGIGLKPKDLEHIFVAFEQLDSSYARRQQGTGLGLTLAQSLVELHGGRIWAESEGEGKGSKFTFAIPIIAASGISERSQAL
ncbi:MAG: PAS domain-containing sensor histidine kinase [Desulfomonilaceae bacterium]